MQSSGVFNQSSKLARSDLGEVLEQNAPKASVEFEVSSMDNISGFINLEADSFQSTSKQNCPTPDESSLPVDEDAPLCNTVQYAENDTRPFSTKKIISGFRLPSSKKSRKAHLHNIQDLSENLRFSNGDLEMDLKKEKNKKKVKNKGLKAGESKKKSSLIDEFANINITADMKTSAAKFPSNMGKESRSKHLQVRLKDQKAEYDIFSDTRVFGVPLEIAVERDPSHDGVPLPAFFRHCIDFIEEYGLTSEGIYRVPGVNSQVKMIINALNNGIQFPNIAASSPTHSQHSSGIRHQTLGFAFTKGASKAVSISDKFTRLHSPPTQSTMPTSSHSISLQSHDESTASSPPHDPAVVTSVLKHFLRNLPEPVLTNRLAPYAEAACDLHEATSRMRRLVELVHPSTNGSDIECLPRSNRYLLAWLLQHMLRVINRSSENKMTLANLSIVLSPTLGISHRLIDVLLSDSSQVDRNVFIDLLDPLASGIHNSQLTTCSIIPHWLFPNPVFAYRPYIPPMPIPCADLSASFQLPDTLSELEDELYKQESRLTFTLKQIMLGKTSPEKEALIWELQHLITKMKRKKNILDLTDPELIQSEIRRREKKLDLLHQELVKTLNEKKTSRSMPTSSDRDFLATIDRLTPSSNMENMSTRPQYSRLPLSQFDFSKRSKLPIPVNSTEHQLPHVESHFEDSRAIADIDSDLWELQSTVTLLKRRLKMQLRTSAATKTSTAHALPECDSFGAEEVFNFTLRKPPGTFLGDVSDRYSDQAEYSTSGNSKEQEISQVEAKIVVTDLTLSVTSPTPKETNQLSWNISSEETEIMSIDMKFDVSSPSIDKGNFCEFDTFSVDWPPALNSNSEESEPQTSTLCRISQTVPPSSVGKTLKLDESSINLPEMITESTVEDEPLKIEISTENDFPKLKYTIEYLCGRKQELIGIQNDLNSRIRSQKAEIEHINSSIEHLISSGDKQAQNVRQYYRDNRFLLAPSPSLFPSCQQNRADMDTHLSSDAPIFSGSEDDDFGEVEDEEEDEEDDVDENELASALVQLRRDNQRLTALNSSCMEKIIAERNKCMDLKVLLRLNTCLQSTALSISN